MKNKFPISRLLEYVFKLMNEWMNEWQTIGFLHLSQGSLFFPVKFPSKHCLLRADGNHLFWDRMFVYSTKELTICSKKTFFCVELQRRQVNWFWNRSYWNLPPSIFYLWLAVNTLSWGNYPITSNLTEQLERERERKREGGGYSKGECALLNGEPIKLSKD